MLVAAYTRLKVFVGRVTEVTGVVLALFAAYEMVIADRIAPHVTGGVKLCEVADWPDYMSAGDFFAFIEDNADKVVYLDMFLVPVGRDGTPLDCLEETPRRADVSDFGLYAEGPYRTFEDGSSGPTPELWINFTGFETPQTARLTGQSGEEPIFGVTGLVYIEAGEVDAGFQSYTLSAAPYADAMLKKRDCARDYLAADGLLEQARAYVFSCLAS
ncbi:MAG: hypothetical protein AAGD13_14330 [Pseudomonadota bacterium]